MKTNFVLMLIAVLSLILISCSSTQKVDASIFQKYKSTLLFFSDESNYMNESQYYDALLELTDEHPAEIDHMQTLNPKTHVDEYKTFNLSKEPAVIIFSKTGTVIDQVSGSTATKEQIKKTIDQALENR